jgi:hypothetical protein
MDGWVGVVDPMNGGWTTRVSIMLSLESLISLSSLSLTSSSSLLLSLYSFHDHHRHHHQNYIGMVRPGSFETVLVPYEQQVAQKDALEARRKTSKSNINSDDSSSLSTVSSTKTVVVGTASTTTTTKPVYERRDDRTIFVGNLPISINQKIMTNAVEKVVDRTSLRSIRLSLDGDGENT